MAVQSDSFSSVLLTEDDATAFAAELENGKPSIVATQAAARGQQLLAQLRADCAKKEPKAE